MSDCTFHLEAGHALVLDGQTLDLHNNFVFRAFEYSAPEATASLSWTRSHGEWVTAGDPASIRILFTNVTFLKMELAFQGERTDPTTLSFAGYLHADDDIVMNGFLERHEVQGRYHVIFGFEDGTAIKIGASRASVTIT